MEDHCIKSVHFRSFSGPYFPAFGLNKERYEVMVARRRRKVKSTKIVLKVLSYIRILYLKQQSNILQCFCSLKFEKS